MTVELSSEQLQELDQASTIELGFFHGFLAQVRPSVLDGGATILDAQEKKSK